MPIYEPNLELLVKEKGDLIFTSNLKEALNNSNIIFIVIGTPEMEDGSVNLDYIFVKSAEIC